MKCTQSWVSKIEKNKDARIKDIRAYADALGLKMTVTLKERT